MLFLLFLCVSIYLAYVLGGILILESSFIYCIRFICHST